MTGQLLVPVADKVPLGRRAVSSRSPTPQPVRAPEESRSGGAGGGGGARLGPPLREEASEGLCFSGRGVVVAAGPGREQGMTLAPRSAGQLSPSCAGVEATVPARLAFPCPAHLQSAHPAPGRFSFPVCFSLVRPSLLPVPALRSLSPPSAWSSRFHPQLWLLCAQDAPPPPALGPGPSGAGGRGSPDPSAAAASPPPHPSPERASVAAPLPQPSME